MKNKRIFLVGIIIFALILSTFSTVFAADYATIAISPTTKTVKTGDTVDVVISISSVADASKGIMGIGGTIEVDESKVKIESVTAAREELSNQPGYEASTGIFGFNCKTSSSTGITSGNVVKVKLKVLSLGSEETTKITFKGLNYSDTEYNDHYPSDLIVTLKGEKTSTNGTSASAAASASGTTNSTTNATSKSGDVTTAKASTLPQTGLSYGVTIGIFVIAVIGIIAFVRYHNMKNVK